MKQILTLVIVILVLLLAVVIKLFVTPEEQRADSEQVACTAEAKICPDGSAVGRTGPNCEFAACPEIEEDPEVPADIQAHIDSKQDLIVVAQPQPLAVITSPVTFSGQARGQWFFEASFPVILTDWDGRIIAQGIATADGEWMTTDFVDFSGTLEFVQPAYGERGTLIFRKDNPSDMRHLDDALEIPVRFE